MPPSSPRRVSAATASRELLRALDIEYIALTPGASFRGLHDSLVNYLGNERPEHAAVHSRGACRRAGAWLRARHRQAARGRAARQCRPDARDDGDLQRLVRPRADAAARRRRSDRCGAAPARGSTGSTPSRDLGALVRGYTKWDDQPGSVPAALESIVRAYRIATDRAAGPVYVCLDAALQEEASRRPPSPARARALSRAASRSIRRRRRCATHRGSAREGEAAADHDRPRLQRRATTSRAASTSPSASSARVLTDIKTGGELSRRTHPLHPFAAGPLRQRRGGRDDPRGRRHREPRLDRPRAARCARRAAARFPTRDVIQCSLDQYVHNGWSMDYQALPPADILVLATPDRLSRGCSASRVAAREPQRHRAAAPRARMAAPWRRTRPRRRRPATDRMSIEAMARVAVDGARRASTRRTSACRSAGPASTAASPHPLDYIGFDGGGGIGSGPGHGRRRSARAARHGPPAGRGAGRRRLPDGPHRAVDRRALSQCRCWSIVANNQSFFNDELHQERMARVRGRPVENRRSACA